MKRQSISMTIYRNFFLTFQELFLLRSLSLPEIFAILNLSSSIVLMQYRFQVSCVDLVGHFPIQDMRSARKPDFCRIMFGDLIFHLPLLR